MKRQFLLTAALAGALMLGGCDEIFGGDEVTVTVTDACQRRSKSRPLGGAKSGRVIRVLASAARA